MGDAGLRLPLRLGKSAWCHEDEDEDAGGGNDGDEAMAFEPEEDILVLLLPGDSVHLPSVDFESNEWRRGPRRKDRLVLICLDASHV